MKHTESALQYCYDILDGTIPACEYVKLACTRHLKDLERIPDKAFPYTYDVEKAGKACRFIERLPHVKGQWAAASKRIELQPWQIFIISSLFGWVKKTDGMRRFRDSYIEVPRKNGKSVLAAGIGLYMFVADGEHGAEVYSGATTEQQAWEVFRPAKLMAQKAKGLATHYDVSINAKTLCRVEDMSRFEPVIGNPGDGASPSCALVDEYHEHKTSDLHDTMQTGMAARQQPLMFIITTAGFNIGGPCYAKRSDLIKTLQGLYDAPDVFGIIYTLDDGVDWTTREALQMANPNFGVSVSEEFLLSAQQKAIQSAHEQNKFLTKHLDMWCAASAAYFNLQFLKRCEDITLKVNDFEGDECIEGLDLASKIDMCAKVKLFRREVEGVDHYYCFPTFYIPEDRANDPALKMYLGWSRAGLLTLTPGNITDYDYIEEDLKEDAGRFVVLEVPFDPYNATHLANRMMQEGIEMVEYGQTVRNMSDPMKSLEALIRAGRFHYDGNAVLTWMFSNVVAKLDAKDNVFPRKEREENKIDGVVATISALGRWLAQIEDGDGYNGRAAKGEEVVRSL